MVIFCFHIISRDYDCSLVGEDYVIQSAWNTEHQQPKQSRTVSHNQFKNDALAHLCTWTGV